MQSTATHRSGLSSGRKTSRSDYAQDLEAAWIGRSTDGSLCSLEPLLTSIQYKNGAIFRGSVSRDKSRSGMGEFRWLSGLLYTGQFRDGQREGEGELIWPDGSRYVGDFHCDVREGKGKHSWKDSGEVYVGEYHNDKRHGNGVYTWPSGASFRGTFREDLKEGPGVYRSPQGEKFEGMYHRDVRDGEGVLTYPGGVKDEGTWKGTKLMQLKFAIVDVHFDLCCSIPLESLGVSPKRKRRGPIGHLEVASQEFIQQAANNNLTRVKTILEAGAIHVDVTDANKYSALFAAAVNGHCDVVDYLLDNGADVNQLEIRGTSVLNACHHMLYCPHSEVKALLSQHHLTYQQSSSSDSSLDGGDTETLYSSDFLSTPFMDVTTSSIANEKQTDPDLEPMEDSNLYRSISLGPHFHNQKYLCGDDTGVDGGETHPKLRKSQSVPSLPCYRDKKVRFRSDTFKVDKHLVAAITKKKSIIDDPGPGKMQNSIERGLDADSKSTSPAVMAIHVHSDLFQHDTEARISDDTKARMSEDPEPSQDGVTDQTVIRTSVCGNSTTASANGEILGVSAMNSDDDYMSGVNQDNEDNQEKQLNVDADESYTANSSHLDYLGKPESVKIQYKETNGSKMDTMSSILRHIASPINEDTQQLLSLKMQQPMPSPSLGSNLLSSCNFGSIVSAAQSMTVSFAESDQTSVEECSVAYSSLKHTASSTKKDLVSISCVSGEMMRGMIRLLLSRGADPNISTNPVHPMVYTILTGDVPMAGRLLQCGANSNYATQEELGGYSLLHLATKKVTTSTPGMVEILLQYGADSNSNLSVPKKTKDNTSQKERMKPIERILIGGENEGIGTLTPLHFICGVRVTEIGQVKETLTGLIPLVIRLLVTHGGDINRVSNGHSPLSLAILSGHDNAVVTLLENGANPNIPLGQGVANALCALTTHAAHKVRLSPTSTSSIALSSGLFTFSCPLLILHKLLVWGASIISPVKLVKGSIGIVTDFAHAAFKEDKRLSLLKYSSLSKSERTRYRSIKRLQKHLVNLLRYKALHLLASDEDFWHQMRAYKAHMDTTNDILARFHTYRTSVRTPERGMSLKKSDVAPFLINLPEITLKTSLNSLIKVLSEDPVEDEDEDEEDRVEANRFGPKSKKKGRANKIVIYKELIEKANSIFSNFKEADEDSSWGFSSFCYECGRSSGVHLTSCLGCEVVSYCSRICKEENWKKGHREECCKADVIRLRMLSTYSRVRRSNLRQKARAKANTIC